MFVVTLQSHVLFTLAYTDFGPSGQPTGNFHSWLLLTIDYITTIITLPPLIIYLIFSLSYNTLFFQIFNILLNCSQRSDDRMVYRTLSRSVIY